MRETKSERLADALNAFLATSPDVEATAVVSFDGLTMASALPDEMDDDRVGAMSAALLSLGEQAARGLGRGDLQQLFVEADGGFVFLMSAKDEAVLVAVTGRAAKIGFILYEMRRAATEVGELLEHRTLPDAPALAEPGLATLSELSQTPVHRDTVEAAAGAPEPSGGPQPTAVRDPFGDADLEEPFYVGTAGRSNGSSDDRT
jgi:uncharacterized protein